jgi:hypothetical protein
MTDMSSPLPPVLGQLTDFNRVPVAICGELASGDKHEGKVVSKEKTAVTQRKGTVTWPRRWQGVVSGGV